MAWYLCRPGQDSAAIDEADIAAVLRPTLIGSFPVSDGCETRPLQDPLLSLPEDKAFVRSGRSGGLPTRWRNLLSAVGFAAVTVGFGLMAVRLGFDCLFGADRRIVGIAGLASSVALSMALLFWATVRLWRFDHDVSESPRIFDNRIGRVFSTATLLCGLFLLGWVNRRAAEETVVWYRTFEGQTDFQLSESKKAIAIVGAIDRSSVPRLDDWLTRYPQIATVELDLNGGLVDEARKMRRLIASRRLDTAVIGECASACTIAFMGGRHRYYRRGARLGFHRYRYLGSAEDGREYDLFERAYLVSIGLTANFAEKAMSSDAVWYPSVDELFAGNVITAVVEPEPDGAE